MSLKGILSEIRNGFFKWVKVPERVYLVIALIAVIGFVFITPPFQGPDEKAHYIRAQYIAHGFILPVDVKKTNISLPGSIQKVIDEVSIKDNVAGNTNSKYHLGHVKAALKIPFNSHGTYQPDMIPYSSLSYLPAIPGIFIVNLLNLSPIISLYVARLSLALACVLLIFFAIKIIPYKKYLLVAIGLIPMMVFQQAMLTIDGISYALLILFIAYVLYLRTKDTLQIDEWIKIGLICVAITLAKPLVFIFLPLILLLVKRKNGLKWIIGIALSCILLFGAMSLYSSHNAGVSIDPNLPEAVNSSAQLNNMIEHPVRFFRVLWNTYMTWYGDEETRGVIGTFGSADTLYPLWMIFSYIIVLGVLTLVKFKSDNLKNLPPRALKIFIICLAVAYFVCVNLALYLSFSPVNYNIIYGVQGRYFLPLVITLPLLVVPPLYVKQDKERRFLVYIILSIILLIFLALFITYQRYYLFTP